MAKELTLKEARKWVIIDRDDLDKELTHNPEMMMRSHQALGEAQSRRDLLKGNVKAAWVIARDVCRKVKINDKAPTVAQVDDAAEQNVQYREAVTLHHGADEDVKAWAAVVRGVEDRSSMLRKLAEFELSDRYASSAVKEDAASDRMRKARRAAEKDKSKKKKKKKKKSE